MPDLDFTKRYYIFEYDQYYPAGGLSDVALTTDSLTEAKEYFTKSGYDHKSIFDRIEGIEIEDE